MGNNLDKSQSRFQPGAIAKCNSRCTGRERNPTGSPYGLTNGNHLNAVPKLFFTKRTCYLYENKGFETRSS
jgi:hypothetical protein